MATFIQNSNEDDAGDVQLMFPGDRFPVIAGTRAFFRMFETVALTGGGVRAGGAITYVLNEDLKISENGLLCNDTDVNLAAAGIANPIVVGIVSAVPAANNGNRLCIDMKY